MRGLTIIVAGADRPRYNAALSMAAAQAALGGSARIYLHGPAVALLADPSPLASEARALGVLLLGCQSGLAEAGLDAAEYPHVEVSGLVALFQNLGEDRLVTV